MRTILGLPILLLYHLLSWAQSPAPKITLKGQVVDSVTQAPVMATITLADVKSGAALRSMATGNDGVFAIEVPASAAASASAGGSYVLHVSAVGYRISLLLPSTSIIRAGMFSCRGSRAAIRM